MDRTASPQRRAHPSRAALRHATLAVPRTTPDERVDDLLARLRGDPVTLPWVFHRLGADPAFGSGPLATVVQDFITVAVYFQLATWIVH